MTLEPISQVGGRTPWGLMQESMLLGPGLGGHSPRYTKMPRCQAARIPVPGCCPHFSSPGSLSQPLGLTSKSYHVSSGPEGAQLCSCLRPAWAPALPHQAVVLFAGFAKAQCLPEQVSGSARAPVCSQLISWLRGAGAGPWAWSFRLRLPERSPQLVTQGAVG